MKFYFTAILFLLTFLGCGTSKTFSLKTNPAVIKPDSFELRFDPLAQLKENINLILTDSLFIPARASMKVVSLNNGEVLYEKDSQILMNPASNTKLFTAAAALSILDTNYLFHTKVFVDDLPSGVIITGNIFLKGFGDPDLTSSDIDSLALIIRSLGIRSITGDIIVDDSFFDDNYWGEGWTWDSESDPDAPYINALCANRNCISVTALSDSRSTITYLEPMTDFVTVLNRSKISNRPARSPIRIRRLCLSNPNTIIIDGEIPRSSQVTEKLPLREPEFYVGTLFKESLRHAGVIVNGEIVSGTVPYDAQEIARYSHSIKMIVTNMNKVSYNLAAENLLKVLGAVKHGIPGTSNKGIFAENTFFSSIGMDTTKFLLVDGSGVSRHNLLNTDQIVRFLCEMYKQQRIFPIFYNSFPIAGVDGTLSRRMTTYPAACNVRAKTGMLNGVNCLSGYVQTRDGEMLAFSLMMQNFITPANDYRQVQDRIGALLAGFSREISVNKDIKNETVVN